MPNYKTCAGNLMSTLMNETTTTQTGYVQAPNGKYYGLTDNNTPFLGHMDQLRYWIQQDTDMSALFVSSAVIDEVTVSVWFASDMTTTYKFMAAIQYVVSFIYSTNSPNKEFDLSTNPSTGLWELSYINGGDNPNGPIPPPAICS